MRRQTKIIRLLFALALAASLGAEAAAQSDSKCPTVTVECPDSPAAGQPVTFKASVSGDAPGALTYNWVVNVGTITKGQGTPTIVVDITGVERLSLTAVVEVGGLPASCPKASSCSPNVCVLPISPRKIDEYGDLRWSDEKARLDNFAVELKNNPTAQGYIVAYGGRRGRAGEAQRRADRAMNYLASAPSSHEALRIVTVDGGFREGATTELFIVPSGATPPLATPTVGPAEVEIIRPKPKR